MMDNLNLLLDEAIKIELGISKLYQLFSAEIIIDKEFWWELALEEVNHASILRAGKNMVSLGKFPKDILPDSFEELTLATQKIQEAQLDFLTKPERLKAFELAYNIEEFGIEIHYQKYLRSDKIDSLRRIFQELNKSDIDHAKRIKDQWELALQEQTTRKKP